jgi:hypothetical protein
MLSRSQFIKLTASGIVSLHPSVKFLSQLYGIEPDRLDALISMGFQYNRPNDLLSLYFYFINIDPAKSKVLSKLDSTADAFMLIRLPQMHVAEHVVTDCQYYTKGKQDLKDSTFFDHKETVNSFPSSFSLLAFKLNFSASPGQAASDGDLELCLAELLNWNKHVLLTEANLAPGSGYKKPINHTPPPSTQTGYPLVRPAETPFKTTAGIPISHFEFPYKLYITPAVQKGAKARYYFSSQNDLRTITIITGDRRNKVKRMVDVLYNNEMLVAGAAATTPSFRIIGFAEDYGGAAQAGLNESMGEKSPNGSPANTCGVCTQSLRTAGLLPYGSYTSDKIYRPGVGNGMHHRMELTYLSNLDATDRDLHSTLFLFTAWGGYSFLQYSNPVTKDPATGIDYSILSFKERIVLGRDEFIEVVTEGYDQFCIKCYYIQIGKVSFVNGNRYIRYYVIIKYPDHSSITYADSKGGEVARFGVLDAITPGKDLTTMPVITRSTPYQSITPVTTQTPDLDPAKDIHSIQATPVLTPADCDPRQDTDGLMIFYNGQPFTVEYQAIDWNGNKIKVVKPLLFIDSALWSNPTSPATQKKIQTLNTILNDPARADVAPFRIAQTFKQKIAYVSVSKAEVQDAYPTAASVNHKVNEVQTDWIDFYSNLAGSLDQPLPCMPALNEASVYLPQLQGLVSNDINIGINYAQKYLTSRFVNAANSAKVYANLTERTVDAIKTQLADPKNLKALGGLATPDIPIQSLSIRAQSITLHENAVIDNLGNINPKEILRGAFPALFRGIDLLEILNEFVPLDNTPIFNVVQQFNDDLDEVDQQYQGVVAEIKAARDAVQQKLNDAKSDLTNYTAQLEAISGIQPAIQRLTALKNELLYSNRIVTALKDVKKFAADEIQFVNLQLQNAKQTITGQINTIAGEAVLRCVDAGVAVVDARKQAQQAFNAYADLAVATLTKQSADFMTGVWGIVTDATLVDPATQVLLDYETIKTRLNAVITPITAYRTSYAGAPAALGKFSGLFPSSQLQAILTGYLQYADNLSFVQTLSDVNNLPTNPVRDLKKMYAVLTTIFAKVEEEANLKGKVNTGDATIPALLIINKELHKRKKLFSNFYAERVQHLTTEYGQVSAALNNNVILKAVEDLAAVSSNTVFPAGGFDLTKPSTYESYTGQLKGWTDSVVKLKTDLNATFKADLDKYKASIADAQSRVQQFTDQLNGGIQGVLQTVSDELDQDLQDVVQATGAARQALLDKIAQLQRIVQYIQQGTKINRSYTWNTTDFRDADLDIIQFKVHTNPQTELSITCTAAIALDYSQIPPAIKSYTFSNKSSLSNFSIVFLGILDVNFRYIQFTDATDGSPHLDIKIDHVGFAGALAFLQNLESILSAAGEGLKLDVQPAGIQLSYSLGFPDIPSTPGSFGFANLNFEFGVNLPFDGNPLQCSFKIADPNNKFRVTAGIFTGWGYFGLVAQPKNGIESMEISLELGVYAGITIGGVLNGFVQFGIGLYYGRTGSMVEISGYISCEGHAALFGFGVTVSLYMSFTSEGNTCTGQASVSYSISLGFFSLDFEEQYTKTIYGSGSGGNNAANRLPEPSLAYDDPGAALLGFVGGPLVVEMADDRGVEAMPDDGREAQFAGYWNAFF